MNQKSSRTKIDRIIAQKEKQLFDRHLSGENKSIYINLGAQCNEDCNFCLIKGVESKFPFMSFSEAKRIIRNFSRCGGKTIMFTGGEPTLRDDLPLLIRYAGDQGIGEISVITNAVRLSDRKYFDRLIEADKHQVTGFGISFHSHLEKISEKITKAAGSFKKTIQGIKNVSASGRPASFYQVITKENFRHIPSFSRYIYRNFPRISFVTFAYPFPQGNAFWNKDIYVPFDILKPFLLEGLSFLEKRDYHTDIAACGQLPLCTIPGFEEKVIRPVLIAEKNVSGVVSEKVYHEFEWGSDSVVHSYKSKTLVCRKCILNSFCQGFWRRYIDQFGFRGVKPSSFESFKGVKVTSELKNIGQLQSIMVKLDWEKLNLIRLTSYEEEYYRQLFRDIGRNKILAIITKK